MKIARILGIGGLLWAVMMPRLAHAQFIYTTNADGVTLTITGYTGSGGALDIPDHLGGMPVTGIGPYAFSVDALTSVVVPGSVATIGNGAFEFCGSLGDVVISNGVTTIGDYAFQMCGSLNSINIPASVTNIGNAFYDCTSLKAINVEAQNSFYSSTNGVLFDKWGTTLLNYPFGLGGDYAIPEGVTSIGTYAFEACEGLSSVTIPDSVTNIGAGAFDRTGITKISFGANIKLTSIGDNAFFTCFNLTTVTIPNSVTSIGDSAFMDCSGLTNVTLSDGLTSIGDNAFVNTKLAGVSIPNTLTNIGYEAFANDPLVGVVIPGSVVTIGDNAFSFCNELANLVISNGVSDIGYGAFSGCPELGSVFIPASVASIGLQAFSDCASMTNILVSPQNMFYTSLDGVLFDKSQSTLVQYPDGLPGNYLIPNGVVDVGDWSFYGAHVTGVVIPNTVTNIGLSAFEDCASLTNAVIGDGVIIIGEAAFLGCAKLGGIAIPDSVTTIGFAAFRLCSEFVSVTIPDSVVTIADYAFADCSDLNRVIIGKGVASIGDFSFAFCNDLRSVYFRGNVPGAVGDLFESDTDVTVYYLPETTGWGPMFGGFPTAFWFLPNPVILNNGLGYGVQTNGFGFTVFWATNTFIVVEACGDLARQAWTPVATNSLIGGTFYFKDSLWTNYSSRFYRLRLP